MASTNIDTIPSQLNLIKHIIDKMEQVTPKGEYTPNHSIEKIMYEEGMRAHLRLLKKMVMESNGTINSTR